MNNLLAYLICRNDGQDVAEYAVKSAVVLAVVVAIIRLMDTNAGAVFSNVAGKLR